MVVALCLALAQTAEAPSVLNWQNFDQVKAYASPKSEDLGFYQIDWKSTVAQGVNAAREQDKPIVLWLFFGDPRGSC